MNQYDKYLKLQEIKALIVGVGQYNRQCVRCEYCKSVKNIKTCVLPSNLHTACNRLRFPNGLEIDPESPNYMKDKKTHEHQQTRTKHFS
jgi:hypothetical protein